MYRTSDSSSSWKATVSRDKGSRGNVCPEYKPITEHEDSNSNVSTISISTDSDESDENDESDDNDDSEDISDAETVEEVRSNELSPRALHQWFINEMAENRHIHRPIEDVDILTITDEQLRAFKEIISRIRADEAKKPCGNCNAEQALRNVLTDVRRILETQRRDIDRLRSELAAARARSRQIPGEGYPHQMQAGPLVPSIRSSTSGNQQQPLYSREGPSDSQLQHPQDIPVAPSNETSTSKEQSQPTTSKKDPTHRIICWRCRKRGHRADKCSNPRTPKTQEVGRKQGGKRE